MVCQALKHASTVAFAETHRGAEGCVSTCMTTCLNSFWLLGEVFTSSVAPEKSTQANDPTVREARADQVGIKGWGAGVGAWAGSGWANRNR